MSALSIPVHVPLVAVTDWTVAPVGTGSVTTASGTGSGPLLVAVSVNVMSGPGDIAGTVSVRPRSAFGQPSTDPGGPGQRSCVPSPNPSPSASGSS